MEAVWIVGREHSEARSGGAPTAALPLLRWELRGIYTHEQWALNGCRTPLDFVAEVALDQFIDDRDGALMQVRYPLPVGA